MMAMNIWKYIVSITGGFMVLSWIFDIIMFRPYHIGPLQFRYVLLTSIAFVISLALMAKDSIARRKEVDAARIVIQSMNSNRGYEPGIPTLEGILMSFYMAHRNPEDWSMKTRRGIRYLSYLKIYIKDRTGEEFNLKEIHDALELIDRKVKNKEKELKLRKMFEDSSHRGSETSSLETLLN